MTTENTTENPTATANNENSSTNEISPATLSLDKPNYLTINTAVTDSAAIKELLKNRAGDVLKINPTTPVEFIVTDQLNNPISFTDFSVKAGIDFPVDLLAGLSDNFSLFVYIDQGAPKIGLAIDIKNLTALKSSLKKSEPNLIAELAPLYLDTPYSATAVVFKNSVYKEAPVRYFNIISPAKLSVDYILSPTNKIIIGTTRETAASIFDYVTR